MSGRTRTRRAFALAACVTLFVGAVAASARLTTRITTAGDGAAPLGRTMPRQPVAFEANRGQTDRRVRFLARAAGSTLFLTSRQAVLASGGSALRTVFVGANGDP